MTETSGSRPRELTGCAVVFEPADPPRMGHLAWWCVDGSKPPAHLGQPGTLTVAVRDGTAVRPRTLPVARTPVGAALADLVRIRRDGGAHPAASFWGAVAIEALTSVARGRLLPGVSPEGFDAWRIGPLDAGTVDRIHALAAAMPAEARAVPLPGTDPLELPAPEDLIRAFMDAVADTMPRTPAAAAASGGAPFAATAPQQVPELRAWAHEVSAGIHSGVRVSLRVEVADGDFEDGVFRAVLQVHSVADPALVVDAADLWEGARSGFDDRARFDAVLAVRRAARVWEPLGRLLDVAVPDAITLTDGEVEELLDGAAAPLATAGVDVHWPKGLVHEMTAGAVVGAGDPPPFGGPAFLGGDQSFSLDWRIALAGAPLSEKEMDLLAEAHRPVVRLRGQWTLVPPALARKARDRPMKPLPAFDALTAALTGSTEIDGERVTVLADGWLKTLRDRIADPSTGHEQVRTPAGLTATLRDYQLRGLGWLHRMTSLGLGGCLADDMGLGKTITLIALHLHRQADPATTGPTLVVCPASLLGNWEREITRFAPGTPVRRFHGAGRALDGVTDGFVLTTYGTMRLDAGRLAEVGWRLVVADEAQHVKNPRSGTARALRTIPAPARVALTGTPIENNLTELWAILDWTTPGLLGTLTAFRRRWAETVEGGRDPEAAERLSRLLRPFLLRRRKTDPGIAPELPAKIESTHPTALTREQAALYEALVREVMEQIAASDGMARRGLVMRLLTGLKQICNHPAHYLKEERPWLPGRSGKLDLLDELVTTITAEDGAVLVFTQYVAMARLIEGRLTERGVPSLLLHGGTPIRRREEMVRAFQEGGVPVFLLSLKAAGTGLNLTRADHVVHYDRWWNPAVEEQATDRAHRIGQTRSVQVHRLVTEGTIEDRIDAMLRAKRELADAVLTSGEAALTELSDTELAELVELRSER
ncbi:DEAD/DEAH box helicase [Marinactinospora thermotolerans]|uniref:DEAD/DEAH box helicase n=1 Tax=Marinactinospora thermotolerans TaxID=531310 RepID=UPI003D8F60CB